MADGLVGSVLSYLNSDVQSELGSVFSCLQELQDFSSASKAIEAILRDAESRQRKEEALSDWLEKIKDVAYDVEDLLDEWRAESIKYENEESGIPPFAKRVCNSVLRTFSVDERVDELGFHVKLGIEMGRRLKNVRERLNTICGEKSNFHLEESIDSTIEMVERKTSSLIDESEIIGRTSDKERIMPWLLSDSSHVSNDIPIISEVAMGKANYLQSFKQNADSFICSLLLGTSGPQIQYSPGGQIFKAGGSNMQHLTLLSFLLLAYSNYISHSRQFVPCGKISATPAQLRRLAKRQVDYILGNNPKQMSYMVGYSNRYPLRIHHRASSIPSVASHPAHIACKAGSRYYLSPNPNPNNLVGAVVGRLNITDDFPDSRPFFQESEPTTYINAPLVGLLGYIWAHPNPT